MTDYQVPPHNVPGWTAALRAIDADMQPGEWQHYIRVTTIALSAAIPHIRAETMADLSDDLADHFPDVAEILDHASYEIREALTR